MVDVMDDPEGFGGVVARTARLLDELGADAPPIGLADLVRKVGIPKTTVWRLLNTLCASGFVERFGSGYVVGSRLMRVAPPRRMWWC
ncbi:helix-turn-helix domain-containing protein [Nocardia sp. NPDC051570]|uniref:helix-turn-helix domain-containing protein n=1 Tax=Nocardia sp. NPDC051570 TaxID=3364324 RepID=UPI0037AB5B71